MYAPPMPLEQPPMVNDRPGVRALRGAAPPMSPQMQRMRDWANSQRAATAANARNGDFIMNPSPGGPTAGVPLPTQLPTPQAGMPSSPDFFRDPTAAQGFMDFFGTQFPGREDMGPPMKPNRPTAPPIKPGMLPPDKSRLTGRRG